MQTVLNVEGMSCSHCENAVKTAVSKIDGVTGVTVDLAGKTVVVDHKGVSPDVIKETTEELGFDVA